MESSPFVAGTAHTEADPATEDATTPDAAAPDSTVVAGRQGTAQAEALRDALLAVLREHPEPRVHVAADAAFSTAALQLVAAAAAQAGAEGRPLTLEGPGQHRLQQALARAGLSIPDGLIWHEAPATLSE